MTKIYSYILKHDSGSAPNPFWNICTLTICKPAIRRTASIGDWIIGTGSKRVKCNDGKYRDFSNRIVYAMKVTEKKTLEEYSLYCKNGLRKKIPVWRTTDWRLRLGDCIYDYSTGNEPILRKSVHNESNRKRDLSGSFALLSKHFYYFGCKAESIPDDLKVMVKESQGHKVIKEQIIVSNFKKWVKRFTPNKIYGIPQLTWKYNRGKESEIVNSCAAMKKERAENARRKTEEPPRKTKS